MKIISNFVDLYDLQHAMDKEWVWERETSQEDVSSPFPPNLKAVVVYLGQEYHAEKGSDNILSATEDVIADKYKDEPIVLVLPIGSGKTRIIKNPSTLQVLGIAKIDANPYRVHQEIETFLRVRGKLQHGE